MGAHGPCKSEKENYGATDVPDMSHGPSLVAQIAAIDGLTGRQYRVAIAAEL